MNVKQNIHFLLKKIDQVLDFLKNRQNRTMNRYYRPGGYIYLNYL